MERASAIRTGSGGSTRMGTSACSPALVDGVIAMAVCMAAYVQEVCDDGLIVFSFERAVREWACNLCHTAGLPIS